MKAHGAEAAPHRGLFSSLQVIMVDDALAAV